MPHYRIEGTDEVTGQERTFVVAADGRDDAADIARQRGIVVSMISRMRASPPIGYASRITDGPKFTSLRLASYSLYTAAGLLYLLVSVGLFRFVQSWIETSTIPPLGWFVRALDNTVLFFSAAAILHALGAGSVILRDIMRSRETNRQESDR